MLKDNKNKQFVANIVLWHVNNFLIRKYLNYFILLYATLKGLFNAQFVTTKTPHLVVGLKNQQVVQDLH
jgi:hypothetical protein